MTGEDYPPFRDGLPKYVVLKNVAVPKKLPGGSRCSRNVPPRNSKARARPLWKPRSFLVLFQRLKRRT